MHIRYEGAPATEVSEQFIQGMVDRMAVSYHKYGAIEDAFPFKVDALDSLRVRLREYEKTGNAEFLIDAANFAMIEFLRPSKQNAHFNPDALSPGRRAVNGNLITDERNVDL